MTTLETAYLVARILTCGIWIGAGLYKVTHFEHTVNEIYTDGSRFPPGIVVGSIAETADAEVGFVLRSSVRPAAGLSQVDYVKVIIGWSALDADLQDGVVDSSTTTTTAPTTSTSEG